MIITIDLRKRVPGGASLEFLRVEMAGIDASPFALVRYAKHGMEQLSGLRLDLDKRSFLDHFEDQEQERVLDAAAPLIVEMVATADGWPLLAYGRVMGLVAGGFSPPSAPC